MQLLQNGTPFGKISFGTTGDTCCSALVGHLRTLRGVVHAHQTRDGHWRRRAQLDQVNSGTQIHVRHGLFLGTPRVDIYRYLGYDLSVTIKNDQTHGRY